MASLFRKATTIICATDAGREGELIFRNIAQMSRCKGKPTQRLWLSSLTTSAIGAAFASLKPAQAYDYLAAAARCRSQADWLVGLNATRNYTARHGEGGVLWSVGRVQTPVLALIAERDDEIVEFVSTSWFELRTRYRDVLFVSTGARFEAKPEADALAERIAAEPFVIGEVKTRTQHIKPPQLYDLTTLQRDMNVRYGMSAAQTLSQVQALYESKAITYPRTDSRHLPASMKQEMPGLLAALGQRYAEAVGGLELSRLRMSARTFDDTKITDHHAIIPTTRPGPTNDRIYDAVALRTIASFYPDCEKALTTVDGAAADVRLRAKGVRVVKAGFTSVLPGPKSKTHQLLPAFVRGEQGPHQPEVHSGQTQPPKHFTDSSLLGAMETAGRLVDDEQLKEALKARGLGTPATRAAIIETLLRRDYIRREDKALRATDLGRYLVALLRDPILKSAELTGEWEAKLKEIEAGRLSPDVFMAEVETFTRAIITASGSRAIDAAQLGECPRCGAAVIEGKRGFGCSRWQAGCRYVLWKSFEGAQITTDIARELLQHRLLAAPVEVNGVPKQLCLTRSGTVRALAVPVAGSQSSSGNGSRRGGRSGNEAKRKSSGKPGSLPKSGADGGSLGTCPSCGSAVVDQPKSYSCSGWRQGCSFVVWKTMSGKRISRAMATKLLVSGRTQMLKGFVSKANKKFDARLRVQDGKVGFEF
ncbi:MAG: topoisomerase C-terminal repeat-containing protein [Nannocystaceae bacterium]|nr:topoisomerase C-terminal repeat-containing protein [Nannocystaceae bacterium]